MYGRRGRGALAVRPFSLRRVVELTHDVVSMSSERLKSFEIKQNVYAHTMHIPNLQFSPNGKQLAVAR